MRSQRLWLTLILVITLLVAIYRWKWNLMLFTGRKKLPNIVFILTDDQDVQLGSANHMPKLDELVTRRGATFSNAFSTTPLCCPSRASILTGSYVHNHGVVNNSATGNCGGREWVDGGERRSVATHLKAVGYNTFYAGKYLNRYGRDSEGVEHIPPGWDHWFGLVGNSVYYNYTLSVDGRAEVHGDDPKDYLTNVINEHAVEFIRRYGHEPEPFFMMLAPPACHAPFTPFPTHAEAFGELEAPRTPHFNRTGGKTKHWLLRKTPSSLPGDVITKIDDIYRNRLRTLLSVDDSIESVVGALEATGLLDNTYVFFTSDHGYHLGQFSMPLDKRQMYEFDIRVPLLVMGPGVPSGAIVEDPVVNIDLAPTFLELAGQTPPSTMDGVSFASLFVPSTGGSRVRRNFFLVEYHGEGLVEPWPGCPQYAGGGVSQCDPDCICEDAFNNTYNCIRLMTRHNDTMYCAFEDDEKFVEMYDLHTDPHQLTNLAFGVHEKDHSNLAEIVSMLRKCTGDGCPIRYEE